MMYAKNAKFTTAQSQPTLTFMENCVVEICGLDPYITYTHMFVYVRQLAIHLRGAMTTRKKVCVLIGIIGSDTTHSLTQRRCTHEYIHIYTLTHARFSFVYTPST